MQSGIKAEKSIATASSTSFGLNLGLAFRAGGSSFTPFIGGQMGSLDPGTGSVKMYGATAGLSFSHRY